MLLLSQGWFVLKGNPPTHHQGGWGVGVVYNNFLRRYSHCDYPRQVEMPPYVIVQSVKRHGLWSTTPSFLSNPKPYNATSKGPTLLSTPLTNLRRAKHQEHLLSFQQKALYYSTTAIINIKQIHCKFYKSCCCVVSMLFFRQYVSSSTVYTSSQRPSLTFSLIWDFSVLFFLL